MHAPLATPRKRDRDVDTRLRRLAAQPALTPAVAVREHLAASRAEGLPFARAWEAALAELPPDRPGAECLSAGEQWRRAVVATRDAFQRAYDRRAPTPGDRAAGALADVLGA